MHIEYMYPPFTWGGPHIKEEIHALMHGKFFPKLDLPIWLYLTHL